WKQTVGNAQSKQIEGVILGGDAQAELIAELQSQNVAVVLVNNYKPGLDIPCVVSDERDGVRQAIEHLYSRGHRHIAMIAGRLNPYIIGARYNAFLEVMAEYGLSVDTADIEMCDPTVESSTKAAMKLLSRSDRATAVFGSNDVVASGAFKAASRLGLRIPEDVAIAGFDDSSICPVFEPELTSVHVNCRRMGEICAQQLTALLDGKRDIPRLTVIPAALQVRRST
ncbi:MAG: substrate-binding domain-containing protein, partial [Clostridia bacterium]|nr:substrate-binding domain-containing protein [Clostridia bacterium]